MLVLPSDFESWTAGHLATELLRQADAIGEYRSAARLLVRACMELLRDTRFSSESPTIHFEERVVRINDHAWLIADDADDELIRQVPALAKCCRQVNVVTPPWAAIMVRAAVAPPSARGIIVQGVDAMVDLRVLLTSLDTGAESKFVLSELLCRYGELCVAHCVPHLDVERERLAGLVGEARAPQAVNAARLAPALATEPEALVEPIDGGGDNVELCNSCELCESVLNGGGDEWDGLCPECADVVSNLLDELGLDDDSRDQTVCRLKHCLDRVLAQRRELNP